MKNKKTFAVLLLTAVLLVAVLSSCSLFGSTDTDGGETYKIVFMEIAGLAPIELDGGSITLPTPQKDGYIFDGWYTSKSYTQKFDQDYLESHTISSDIRLYPKWVKIAKVIITLDANGGDAMSVNTVEVNCGVSVPQELGIPTCLGKEFDGWFTSANGGTRVTGADGILVNYEGDSATLYAHWNVAYYTVSVASEGSDTATVTGGGTEYLFGDEVTVSTANTDTEHYTFVGWYDGTSCESTFQSFDYTVTGNVELVAKWRGCNIVVKFYSNHNSSDARYQEKSAYYGGAITYKPAVRMDYAFNGWYDNVSCVGAPVCGADGEISGLKPVHGTEVALYAGWTHLPEGNVALEYDEATEEYTVVGLNNVALDVVHIPHERNGKPVTGIAEGAFSTYVGKSYVIPSTVTTVEGGAFNANSKIYLDNGADTSIVTTAAFASSMDIYFHVLADGDDNALCDGRYAEADGRLIDTTVDSMADAKALYQYCFLYTVPEFTLTFTEEAYDGSDTDFVSTVNDYFDGALTDLALKTNTSLKYSYSTNSAARYIKYTFTAENKVATQKTLGADRQRQSISANVAFAGGDHEFKIDKKPSFRVQTSEQLVYAVERGYSPYFVNAESEAAKIYTKARTILSQIVNGDMTDAEKLLAIHDWIAINVIYDSELYEAATGKSSDIQGYRGFNLEGVFTDGRAVCDGITKAFTLMARIEGIECIRVSGQMGGTGHAWNKVRLGDDWYVVDVTSDDVIMTLGGVATKYEELRHTYFLTSDAKIASTHVQNDPAAAPVANGSYNYCTATSNVYNTQSGLENNCLKKVVELAKDAKSGDMITVEFKAQGIAGINYNYIYKNIKNCSVYGGDPGTDGVITLIVLID